MPFGNVLVAPTKSTQRFTEWQVDINTDTFFIIGFSKRRRHACQPLVRIERIAFQ